jgi:hypothetical protein
MNFDAWLVWGFGSTIVLTTILAGSQGLGLTRMNIPYLLGTLVTPNRDRAKVYGVLLHVVNGWVFSFVYVAAFHASGRFETWVGAAIGFVHATFVLVVGLPVLPGIHPRMASEVHGPTVVRQLEPPGFLGKNYGVQTPVCVLLAHVVFGAMLGGLYSPS